MLRLTFCRSGLQYHGKHIADVVVTLYIAGDVSFPGPADKGKFSKQNASGPAGKRQNPGSFGPGVDASKHTSFVPRDHLLDDKRAEGAPSKQSEGLPSSAVESGDKHQTGRQRQRHGPTQLERLSSKIHAQKEEERRAREEVSVIHHQVSPLRFAYRYSVLCFAIDSSLPMGVH